MRVMHSRLSASNASSRKREMHSRWDASQNCTFRVRKQLVNKMIEVATYQCRQEQPTLSEEMLALSHGVLLQRNRFARQTNFQLRNSSEGIRACSMHCKQHPLLTCTTAESPRWQSNDSLRRGRSIASSSTSPCSNCSR